MVIKYCLERHSGYRKPIKDSIDLYRVRQKEREREIEEGREEGARGENYY